MTDKLNRNVVSVAYTVAWILIAAVWLLNTMITRNQDGLSLLDLNCIINIARNLLPFLFLFLANNYILIPRLLLKNRIRKYLVCALILIAIIWCWQWIDFTLNDVKPKDFPPRHHGPRTFRPLLPLPLFLDFIYGLLVIGINLTVSLITQRFQDTLERETLTKLHAEQQLAYLKTQINPHFYMNMLNNIHGMIEINPETAQQMVIDMSNLMRYMLYDSSQPEISLGAEIRFLEDYLKVMRRRYPEEKVYISSSFPDESQIGNVTVPPLLFLVFIENAFKHGVSYSEKSFVGVSITISGDTLTFSCLNKIHASKNSEHEGIGLANIRSRINLLYGDRATLSTVISPENIYSVNLTIPLDNNHATQDDTH